MYCSPRLRLAALVAISTSLPYGCARNSATPQVQRLAILRFENLSGDISADWMGRAFSEVLTAALSGAPGIETVSTGQLHVLNATLGPRPLGAPGISAERGMALAAGANRIGYGDYTFMNGRLRARLTIEDVQTGKMARVLTTSGTENVSAAAMALGRQLSEHPASYTTPNPEALKAWSKAIESTNAHATRTALEESIAADPDFALPYRALAQWKVQHQDVAGAVATLQQAVARGNRISELERARIEVDLATLRNDAGARERALAALLKLDRHDPLAYRAVAETAMRRRNYTQAVQAWQKSLELDPGDTNSENQLAYAAAYAGDLDTAVRSLRRYESQRPTDPNPLDSLGDVNLITGHCAEAESFYLQALKRDPNFLNNADYFKAAMARLMTGDIAGADALAKQYADARAAAHDPSADYHRAEWSWISGRRKAGYQRLTAFAEGTETGQQHELASRAYAELAIWSLLLGDRAAATEMAQKSAPLAGPSSLGLSLISRFLAQPPASASEWAARADRLFPNAAGNPIRDLALAYALLLDRQFQPASPILKSLYESMPAGADEGTPYLLAWTLLESGRGTVAAPLLKPYPVPPPTGVGPTMSFYFPRFYYLRGLAAEKQGRANEAKPSYDLFKKLSGDAPFVWDK